MNTHTRHATVKQGYFSKHWNILKHSFKMDETALKLAVTDVGFIITLMLSYVLLYYIIIRNYLSISNILDMANTGNVSPSISGMDMVSLWNNFVSSMILLLLLAIILYIIINSIYGAISHVILTNGKFSLGLLINFVYAYSIITLIYLLLVVLIFVVSKDIMVAAWVIVILTLIYAYAMLIFYLVTKDGNISKIFKHGLLSMARLHDTIVPLLLSGLMMIILMMISIALFGQFVAFVGVLLYAEAIAVAIWLRRYMHKLIHT